MINRVNGSSQIVNPSPGPMLTGDFAPDTNRDVDFAGIWRAIARRRVLALAVFGLFLAFVVGFTLLQPRVFTTQTKMIVGSANYDGSPAGPGATSSLPVLNFLLGSSTAQTSETYAELIQQLPVASEVARDLKLDVSPGKLLTKVKVKPVPDTAILAINASWGDPETSARIANAFAAVFVKQERQLVTRQADGAIRFLQEQLPGAEARMRSAQSALAAYQGRANIVDLPAQTTSLITTQATLDAKAQAAELEGRQAAASLETVMAELAATPKTIVGQESISANPVSATLATQVATLQAQLSAARAQYTDDYPTVIQLRSQLAEAKRELRAQPTQVLSGTQTVPNPLYQQLSAQVAQLQATVNASQAQQATLARQQADSRPALARLPEQARRITDLQRSAKSAQDVYDALQRKYQDATISKTTAISDVSVTQIADPRNAAKTPNLLLNLLLGIVVGLALAFAAVFVAEFFDDRFRTEEDVKLRLGMPVLATIPQLTDGNSKDNVWVKPLSVESFYQLVAALRYSSHAPPRTIAFTSPDQGDGKSTVAVNTALSMGLMKARVLVIDADLRRPSVHGKRGIPPDAGLSDRPGGVARVAVVSRSTDLPGVSAHTSGRPAPNPVALLQGDGFDRLLKSAAERFDYVIVDGPALRSIVDGIVLGNKVDGTVLVVSSQRSDARSVKSALARLRSVGSINLLGVVLNGTRPDARAHNDYYLGAGQSITLPATPVE
ncbi:MAG: polysaccharide biosynthesis tyrosine autokinase [Vulcanimicrobiaceae bacterium]